MLKTITLIIFACFLLFGCDTKKAAEEINYGTIKDGVYTNSYFKMTIKAPSDWVVQSQAALEELSKRGADLIAGEDKNLKAALKESEKTTVNLISFFKFEQGQPVPFNPSFISVAEKVSQAPGIKKGSDYLFHTRKFLESGQVEYQFPDAGYTTVISGVSFDVMPAKIEIQNTMVYQKYYAAIFNDYALVFVLTYSSETEEMELNDIFNNIEFAK